MTWTVKVANGAIKLPPGLELPDGADVRLTIPDTQAPPSFAEHFAAYVGVANDLRLIWRQTWIISGFLLALALRGRDSSVAGQSSTQSRRFGEAAQRQKLTTQAT
jgi:hypothetical protein